MPDRIPLEPEAAGTREDDESAGNRPVQVLAVSAAGAVAVATAIFGWAGLLAAGSLVAVGGAAAALARVPAAPASRRPPRPGPPVENAPFPSYRQVAEAMSWAEVSPRHFDLGTRPLLVRLLAARLSDHHGVDLTADPDAARQLVGDDVWEWLDPDRAVDRRGQPPGIDLDTLERIVDRLEHL